MVDAVRLGRSLIEGDVQNVIETGFESALTAINPALGFAYKALDPFGGGKDHRVEYFEGLVNQTAPFLESTGISAAFPEFTGEFYNTIWNDIFEKGHIDFPLLAPVAGPEALPLVAGFISSLPEDPGFAAPFYLEDFVENQRTQMDNFLFQQDLENLGKFRTLLHQMGPEAKGTPEYKEYAGLVADIEDRLGPLADAPISHIDFSKGPGEFQFDTVPVIDFSGEVPALLFNQEGKQVRIPMPEIQRQFEGDLQGEVLGGISGGEDKRSLGIGDIFDLGGVFENAPGFSFGGGGREEADPTFISTPRPDTPGMRKAWEEAVQAESDAAHAQGEIDRIDEELKKEGLSDADRAALEKERAEWEQRRSEHQETVDNYEGVFGEPPPKSFRDIFSFPDIFQIPPIFGGGGRQGQTPPPSPDQQEPSLPPIPPVGPPIPDDQQPGEPPVIPPVPPAPPPEDEPQEDDPIPPIIGGGGDGGGTAGGPVVNPMVRPAIPRLLGPLNRDYMSQILALQKAGQVPPGIEFLAPVLGKEDEDGKRKFNLFG